MGEPKLAHEVVGFKGSLEIIQVDAERAPHEHVLRPLHNLAINLQQIASLQCLKPKEIIVEISRICNLSIYFVSIGSHYSQQLWVNKTCISSLLVCHCVELLDHL